MNARMSVHLSLKTSSKDNKLCRAGAEELMEVLACYFPVVFKVSFIDFALRMSVLSEAELPPNQPDVVGSV